MPRGGTHVSRILVGDNFTVSQLPVEFFQYLQALPDEITVLLEFVSPGAANRQVDAALLGPGGIDVIELKRYRGVIAGDANGPWIETFGSQQKIISNQRGASEENPYTQAQNTSDDLKQWVQRAIGRTIRARATVLVVPGNQASLVRAHNYVKFANGVGALERLLFNRQHSTSPHLSPKDIDLIVAQLRMQRLGASTFRGVVQDAMTGTPLSGVQVQVEGFEEPLRTARDGSFSFIFRRGETVNIRILSPAGYHEYEVVEQLTSAEMRQYYQVRPLVTLDGVDALEARLVARIDELERNVRQKAGMVHSEQSTESRSLETHDQGFGAQADELRVHLDSLRAHRSDEAIVAGVVAALQQSMPWRSQQAAVVDMGFESFMEALNGMQAAELAVLVASLEKINLASLTRGAVGQAASWSSSTLQSAQIGDRVRAITSARRQFQAPERFRGLLTGTRRLVDRSSAVARDAATSIGNSRFGRYTSEIAATSSRDFVSLAGQIEARASELGHLEAQVLRLRLGTLLLKRSRVRGPGLSGAAYHSMLLSIAPVFHIKSKETFSTADLARLVFDEVMRDLEKAARTRSATMSQDEKAVVIRELDSTLAKMSSSEQREIARSLGVDRATGAILLQSFAAGGIAFGTLAVAGSTGFGLYLAATTILHAIATTMFGVTLSFGVYTGLTSTIAFLLSPPVFLVLGVGAAGAVVALRGPDLAKRAVGMVLVQVLHRSVVASARGVLGSPPNGSGPSVSAGIAAREIPPENA